MALAAGAGWTAWPVGGASTGSMRPVTGVTGMPGLHAATHALKDIFHLPVPSLGLGGA